MTKKMSMGKRITSICIIIAMLAAMLPLAAPRAFAAGTADNRVADPSTMDSWKDFFPREGNISTENAGGVWMDKSVFTDASAFAGTGITQNDPDSFLVALSAMAANMTVTGVSNVPTDTMIILDLSSSMYNGSSRDPSTIRTMLTSVNQSIDKLQNLNVNNRVGVVVYFGGPDRNQSDNTNSKVLLPLDRYTCTSTYLKANVSSGKLTSVAVSSGVKNSAGKTMAQTARVVTDVAGTYAQLGLLDAMNELLKADTVVPATAEYQPGAARTPVMIFMSDGEPTAATHQFTKKVDAGMGNNTISIRSPNETDFVTQLTASYAKEMVDAHYEQTDALFYSLSLGTSVSLAVMDPANHTPTTIDGYWNKLLSNGAVRITVYNSPNGWGAPTVKKTYTVSTASVDGAVFPAQKAQRNYVDKAFTAVTASQLTDAFSSIVNQINLVSKYTPTLISGDADLSGYISFVDRIGQYMKVTDIKGVLIDGKLFSGADLASNFVSGGGSLGTFTDPTALGMEMVAAVRTRLGLDSDDTARTLITLAYEYGQLSYTDANNYSNYIGWYANAAGQFLGFYHEGTTVPPAATGNAATDPVFVVKSYGYLGAVDESHGVSKSDMMYATVQVRENIATGEQLVTFAVPAALIPVLSYNVTLDEKGSLSELNVSGADAPIRLVYEVALDDAINSYNVTQIVSAEYLADEHNVNSDGSINFYTNQWDHQNTTGYGTVNTYSYFNPSRQNDKYYYLEDALVYSDAQGTVYQGDQPGADDQLYRRYTVYKKDGGLKIETVYRKLSNEAKATAVLKDDGFWYIPKGNVHVNLDGYTVHKNENTTGTLSEASIPFVDTHNHSINDPGYQFYVGSTLGNNGKLMLVPETGIKLTKTMASGLAIPNTPFTFDIYNDSVPQDGRIYPAWLVKADGTTQETSVLFDDGNASVELYPGDILYIGGMTAGQTFRIVERETLDYVATATGLSSEGTVTVTDKTMHSVDFVNDTRGVGNLTIAKEVAHNFGTDYQIPADKVFTIDVTLSGIGTANATFKAEQTNSTITEITTDENGKFTVQLKHDEQFEVFGLPSGTIATVVERNPATGFTPAYWDNGILGDGIVAIEKGATASVLVINDYQAQKVYPVNINLSGEKVVKDAAGNPVTNWPDSYRFTIVLERYGEDGWQQVDSKLLDQDNQSFIFDLSNEVYDAPGVYSYQVYEAEPEIGSADRVEGMIYDIVWHTFSVYVNDTDMDGKLEIVRVHSEHANKDFEPVDGIYTVTVGFENIQTATVPGLATVEIQKILNNPSNSPLVSLAGYNFGLYTDAACTVSAAVGNGIKTISLNPTDAVGEGWIDIQFDTVGSYTFYVKEIPGGINGMTYSDTVIKVVVDVTVHPQKANALVASVSYFNADGTEYDLGNDGEVEFTNTYAPTNAELPIDFVSKELSGRDQIGGEFSFQVQLPNGTPVLNGSNTAQGKVVFNDSLKFDKVGTYSYLIMETGRDGKGVTIDKTVYQMTVTVTDTNGKLTAGYVILNVPGSAVTFKNSYTATSVEHAIEGTKTLEGRTLLNDEFTFILTELTVNGQAIQNPGTWTAENFASGSFAFPTITYDAPGTYTYRVEEEIPTGGKAYGISYDKTQYKVTIVIKDDGEGKLYVDSETVTLLDHTPANALTFLNRYEADPTWAQLGGEKQLIGKVDNALEGGEFWFVLYNSDADWTQGSPRQRVENTAGGRITFDQIDFDTVGDHYFLVAEEKGGQTIDGITYDDMVYRVWIQITDNLTGQLNAAVHIYDSQGIPQDVIRFRNIYTAEGTSVSFEGTKTLNTLSGIRELKENDFTFDLYEANDAFQINGTPIQSKTNDAFGNFSFDEIAFIEADTYYFLIKENSQNPIGGVVYDNTRYHITVVVTDNGKGRLEAQTTIVKVDDETSQSVNTIAFVNEYNAEVANITLGGNKELLGRDLAQGEFKFLLYNANNEFAVAEDAQAMIAFNTAEKTFSFDTVSFTQVGTYYFVVVEDDTVQAERVTFDDSVFYVTVVVTDDENGKLVASDPVITKKGSDEAVDGIAFTNVFVPKPDDITVDIDIHKTVVNKTNSGITPEGFTFLLTPVQEGATSSTVQSNAEGNAKFTLTFTEEDIGKVFDYTLKEVDEGRAGVTYSTAEYAITIEISLDQQTNTLVATFTQNEADTAELVAEFENIYSGENPKTGDDFNMTLWMTVMLVSIGAVITLCVCGKKEEKEATA